MEIELEFCQPLISLCILHRSIYPRAEVRDRIAWKDGWVVLPVNHVWHICLRIMPYLITSYSNKKMELLLKHCWTTLALTHNLWLTFSNRLPSLSGAHPLSERQTHIVRGKGTFSGAAEGPQPVSCQSLQEDPKARESGDGRTTKQGPLTGFSKCSTAFLSFCQALSIRKKKSDLKIQAKDKMTQQPEQTAVCVLKEFFFYKWEKDGHHFILGERLCTAQSLSVIPRH